MDYLIAKPIKQKTRERQAHSLMEYFVEKGICFPATTAKDMLDATSRIYDMEVTPPMLYDERYTASSNRGLDKGKD